MGAGDDRKTGGGAKSSGSLSALLEEIGVVDGGDGGPVTETRFVEDPGLHVRETRWLDSTRLHEEETVAVDVLRAEVAGAETVAVDVWRGEKNEGDGEDTAVIERQ